jgi:aminoglycoside phosphotransferase (APT) family kinase protein
VQRSLTQDERSDRLARALMAEAADAGWRFDSLDIVGAGIEFLVFDARVVGVGRVAVRVPFEGWIANENDEGIDAFHLLRQEAAMLRRAKAGGVPAPAVVSLHRGRRCHFLATELVETDGTTATKFDLGKVASMIHRLEPPESGVVADPFDSVGETLAERLERRARAVSRHSGQRLALPTEPLRAALDWSQAQRRLLHMDLRLANVLVREGRIVGVIDWSNALIGDPALELARIAEYGLLDDAFKSGYGHSDPLAGVPELTVLAYRLDTAVMLAVVFLSEAPDPRLAVAQLRRIDELLARFNRHVERGS